MSFKSRWIFLALVLAGLLSTNVARADGGCGRLPPAHYLGIGADRIAYYESPGRQGPGVLLVHGNTSSSDWFACQVNGGLGRRYRVVAVDLPGAGRSDDPSDPAASYSMAGWTDAIVSVADRLGLAGGVFVGWSLGGDLLLQSSPRLPLAKGYFIVGTAPVAKPISPATFLPNPVGGYGFVDALSPSQTRDYVQAFLRPDEPLPTVLLDAGLRYDGRARAALAQAVFSGAYQDEVEIVSRLGVPIAVVFGKEEQLINAAYVEGLPIPTLWRSSVQFVERAGHAAQFDNSQRFDELLESFVRDVTRRHCDAIHGDKRDAGCDGFSKD